LTNLRNRLEKQFKTQSLNEFLRDPLGYESFEEYLTTIHCIENIHFWFEVEQLQKMEGSLEIPILILYNRFFDIASPEPLNISAEHLAEVDKCIFEKKWDKNIFNNSRNWILRLMKINAHSYTTTQAFDKFVEGKLAEEEKLFIQNTKRWKESTKIFKPKSLPLLVPMLSQPDPTSSSQIAQMSSSQITPTSPNM